MSWFNTSLSLDSLRAQAGNLATSFKEAFEDGDEQDNNAASDLGAVAASLNVSNGPVITADGDSEVERLRRRLADAASECQELKRLKEHAEQEREVQARQFRELLKEKELELQQLAEGAHAASFVNGNGHADNNTLGRHVDNSGEEEKRLRDELRDKEATIHSLQSECSRLRSESSSLSAANAQLQAAVSGLRQTLAEVEENMLAMHEVVQQQTDRNGALESSLREYEQSTSALNSELAAMSDRAEEHAATVADLRKELDVMREAESQAGELTRALEESRSELSSMRQALAERASDVNAINKDTTVYKDQYEALLQEYNAYLEDLSALEKKAEGIEERKRAFDEQTELLQAELGRARAEQETAARERDSAVDKEAKIRANYEQMDARCSELQDQLNRERLRCRQLESEMDNMSPAADNSLSEDNSAEASEMQHLRKLCQDQQLELAKLRQRETNADENASDEEEDASDEEDDLSEDDEEDSAGARAELERCKLVMFDDEQRLAEQRLAIAALTAEVAELRSSSARASESAGSLGLEEAESMALRFEQQSEMLRLAQAELDKFRQEVSDSSLNASALHAEQFESLREDTERCLSVIEEQKAALEAADAQLAEARARSDRLEAEREEMLAELEACKEAMEIKMEEEEEVDGASETERYRLSLTERNLHAEALDLIKSNLAENELLLEDYRAKQEASEQRTKNLEEQLSAFRQETDQLKASHATELDMLESSVRESVEARRSAEAAIAALNQEKQALEQKIAENSAAECERLEQRAAESDRMRSAEDAIAGLNVAKQALERQLQESETARAAAVERIAALQPQVESLRTEAAASQSDASQLQAMLAEAQTRLAESEAGRTGAIERLSQMERQLEHNGVLTEQVEHLNQELVQTGEALNTARSELELLRASSAGQTQLIEQNGVLRDQVEHLNLALVQTGEALNSARSELEQLRAAAPKEDSSVQRSSPLESEHKHILEQNVTLQNQVEHLNQALAQTNKVLAVTQRELEQLRMSSVQNNHASWEAERIQLVEQNATLRSQAEHLNQALVQANEALSSTKRELEQLASQQSGSSSSSWESERKQMVEVLNEKAREASAAKAEIARLAQSMAEEKTRAQAMQAEGEKEKSERESMSKEALNRLSSLVRDRDVEIEALKKRNEALVDIVQRSNNAGSANNSDGGKSGSAGDGDWEREKERLQALQQQVSVLERERDGLSSALKDKTAESLDYLSQLRRLQRARSHGAEEDVIQEERATESGTELLSLRSKIRDLEQKLNVESKNGGNKTRRRFYSESFTGPEEVVHHAAPASSSSASSSSPLLAELRAKLELSASALAQKEDEMLVLHRSLDEANELVATANEEVRALRRKVESLELHAGEAKRRLEELRFEADNLGIENRKAVEVAQAATAEASRLEVSLREKEYDLGMANGNLQQLKELLEEKSQSSESVQREKLQSIAAAAELQSSLSALTKERDALSLQSASKDRELAELRREVSNVIEKKRRLEAELERLRQHLVAVEETYTTDALGAEERERELRKKLQTTEEALRHSSALQSSAAAAASAQSDHLSRQLKHVTEQRDSVLAKLRRVTEEFDGQAVALDNLNMALEAFQRENLNELKLAAINYNERLAKEHSEQDSLRSELSSLRSELSTAQEGLAAAARLSAQLEAKGQAVAALRQEVAVRDELLRKAQSELSQAASGNAGRVDKSLVKNLVVGYVAADAGKKIEVLRVIATVLDFNQEERVKTSLDGTSMASWLLGGWAGKSNSNSTPNSKLKPSDVASATGLDQSLAQAFVSFLENESSPKAPLRLPVVDMAEERSGRQSSPRLSASATPPPPSTSHSGRTTPSSSTASLASSTAAPTNPLLAGNNLASANQLSMPTFAVSRASSSILKQVLHTDPQQQQQQQ